MARAFEVSPFSFGLRDMRPDPAAVGSFAQDGFVVRTSDNVAQYCSTRMGEMLARAGARLTEQPMAGVETELLEYNVIEGGTFKGLVRIRALVRRGDGEVWARTYEGRSTRWGRTHNPENFNEALSNALAEVTSQLLRDDDFARALMGELAHDEAPMVPPPPPSPYPPPPRSPSSQRTAQPPGSSGA